METLAIDPPLASPPRVRRSSASLAVVLAGAVCYLLGLVLLARLGFVAEGLITLALPAACAWAGLLTQGPPRVRELVIIESVFSLLAVLTKLAIAAHWPLLNAICAWGFAGFFVLQVAGFLVSQAALKNVHGAVQSLAVAAMIAAWAISTHLAPGVVDSTGRLLFWGTDAPLALRAIYCVWVVNVLFVQTRAFPVLVQAIVQGVSVAIACVSGEFFHARLLMACHLFVLDMIFGYSMGGIRANGVPLATMSDGALAVYDARVRPRLPWVGTLLCIGLLAAAARWGLDFQRLPH